MRAKKSENNRDVRIFHVSINEERKVPPKQKMIFPNMEKVIHYLRNLTLKLYITWSAFRSESYSEFNFKMLSLDFSMEILKHLDQCFSSL
jgi:hypothetical protein